MEYGRISDYLRIEQVRKKLDLDSRQLLYEFEKNNIRLHVGLSVDQERSNRKNVRVC